MIRRKLQQFMIGRYGSDQLNRALIVVYFILALVNILVDSLVLYTLTMVMLGYCLFRMLSRNYNARRKENALYLKKARPVLCWIQTKKCMMTDKEHRYFRCPKCGQPLRVPRGRGAITVSCRNCGNRFKEKS